MRQSRRIIPSSLPGVTEEGLRALQGHFTDFIGSNRRVLDRDGRIILMMEPDFTWGDFEVIRLAMERSRALGKRWDVYLYLPLGRPGIDIEPIRGHSH